MTRRDALLLLALATACAPGRRFEGTDVLTGQSITLEPRRTLRPDFSGSYLSPQTGSMQLVHTGATLRGRYARHSCGCYVAGSIEGTVAANLAELSWTEDVIYCGERKRRSGTGYLFHRPGPDAGYPAQLFGERSVQVRAPASRFRPAHAAERSRETWTAVGLAEASDEPRYACP